jgi:hypothetical protein
MAVLEWATTEGYEWDHGLVCEGAAAAGNLHVPEWSLACRPGDDFSPSMPLGGSRPGHAAALHGHLKVLQWLHARGCPLDAITCASAARGGHLKTLQWARLEKGCPWDDRTCVQAARGRHLALLQWAHANGCPWDERTCLMAAAYGHLDILQWARANGCPWDERTCLTAAAYGHLPALRWARQSGCPLGEWTCAQMYNAAVGRGYTDVAAWLEANEEATCVCGTTTMWRNSRPTLGRWPYGQRDGFFSIKRSDRVQRELRLQFFRACYQCLPMVNHRV